jgi:hypothetical protein
MRRKLGLRLRSPTQTWSEAHWHRFDFVMRDGGRVEAGVAGELSNLHFFPSFRE